jgi:integrase
VSDRKRPRRRFGRVRQLPSGRWQARYQGPDGGQRTAPETYEHKRDAEQFLVEVEADLMRGDWFDPLAGRTPLVEYAATWIDERDLSVRTAELYRSLMRNHITPWLGHVAVGDLTPPAIRRWRKSLRDGGASVGTMAKAYRLLHAILNTAVEDVSIRTNPCKIKAAGTYEPEERQVATLPQVFALAEAIQPRYRLAVLLATFASLRFGEIMGLQRRHLLVENGQVRIAQAAIQPNSGRTFDGDPKARSNRTLTLPGFLTGEIEHHLRTYVGRSPNAYVFLGPKGGRPTRSNFHRIWHKARVKVGVPDLHLHDLRHTGNTLAAETGATLRDLMNRMGHRSTRAALIYLHARDHRDREIAVGLDRIVSAELNPPKGHAGGTNTAHAGSDDRPRPPLRLVEGLERATGIEPA